MKIYDVVHDHQPITSLTTEDDEDYIKIGKIWYWSIGESLETVYIMKDELDLALEEYYKVKINDKAIELCTTMEEDGISSDKYGPIQMPGWYV